MIRRITNEDRKIIYKIINDAFNIKYTGDNVYTNWYIYEENNQIIGFINYDTIYDKAELEYIYVDSNYRNKKIATKLFNIMINDLIEKNIFQITLEVRCDNNEAISFYKKNNFKIVSIRRGYYNGIDGYLMLKSW